LDYASFINDDLIYDEDDNKEHINQSETEKNENIVSTLEVCSMIGWRYHESQQKPKARGSADINFKDITKDILVENQEEAVNYGTIQPKKGSKPEEEEYEIIDETQRIKQAIITKLGEDKFEKLIKKYDLKEDKDKDKKD
jgi:hypothetical protein